MTVLAQPWRQAPFAATFGLVVLVLALASLPNLLDPMVRHDDFPALLADPAGYYVKTLHEGRWLNYLWHMRGFVTPAWLNFALYQALWAGFATGLALAALGREAPRGQVLALALMIVVAPQATLISLWFNTLTPGMVLVAVFAALATRMRPGTMRRLLVLFVPATLMSYTMYPLYLLVVCLVMQGQRRSWRDLIGLHLWFVTCFALGLVLIWFLNWAEHGVFGIPMAEWRNPQPARDLAQALENLRAFGAFLEKSALVAAYDFAPMALFLGAAFAIGLGALARLDPWSVPYLLSGLLAGLGLLGMQVVVTGVEVAPRTTLFAWLLLSVSLVRAVALSGGRHPQFSRWMRNAVILVIAGHALQTARQYATYRPWQAQTRALAAAIGQGPERVQVSGSYAGLPSAALAGIQAPRGLRLRLVYLTGRRVVLCEETPPACIAPPQRGAAPAVDRVDDVIFLNLPAPAGVMAASRPIAPAGRARL